MLEGATDVNTGCRAAVLIFLIAVPACVLGLKDQLRFSVSALTVAVDTDRIISLDKGLPRYDGFNDYMDASHLKSAWLEAPIRLSGDNLILDGISLPVDVTKEI